MTQCPPGKHAWSQYTDFEGDPDLINGTNGWVGYVCQIPGCGLETETPELYEDESEGEN